MLMLCLLFVLAFFFCFVLVSCVFRAFVVLVLCLLLCLLVLVSCFLRVFVALCVLCVFLVLNSCFFVLALWSLYCDS